RRAAPNAFFRSALFPALKFGYRVVTEQKIHLRTQAASTVAPDELPSFGSLLRERSKARHDPARGRGVRFGRPRKLNPLGRKKTGSAVHQLRETCPKRAPKSLRT